MVMVRCTNDTFYLAATTNETPRTLDVPLDFLADGKTYKAVIYADGPDADWKSNPTSYIISEKQSLTKQDVLKMKLASGGGQAVILLPQ